MDVRELLIKLKSIRVWTPNGSTARQLLDELINIFEAQIPR